MAYTELSIEERSTIQVSLWQEMSLRQIANMLQRSPSTISREVRRNQTQRGTYVSEPLTTSRQMSLRSVMSLSTARATAC